MEALKGLLLLVFFVCGFFSLIHLIADWLDGGKKMHCQNCGYVVAKRDTNKDYPRCTWNHYGERPPRTAHIRVYRR